MNISKELFVTSKESIKGHMANRHGLIAGATGTGKTTSLMVLAEGFSQMGVPVFLSDIKGDLAGLAEAGLMTEALENRLSKMGLEAFEPKAFPVHFWDLYGNLGHPVRTTISEMGPLMLTRLLSLNDIQSSILTIAFKIADDEGLLLLDLKDLQRLLNHIDEKATEYTLRYGNISKASIGAIQRGLLMLETQGANRFFGEPALEISDFFKHASDGRGVINVLSAHEVFQYPMLYSTFLLWLLSELYEALPEVGDLELPKMVFFFDEAHLLFKDTPKALLDKIEQVVRLIRSKGVGIYFITQNPTDVPDAILSQLGHKIQHALRAYTPKDQKAVKAAAATFRPNPNIDIESALLDLAVGEALVSFLDDSGQPTVTQRAFIRPPKSKMGILDPTARIRYVDQSPLHGKYEDVIDRESAYEVLEKRAEQAARLPKSTPQSSPKPQNTRKTTTQLERMTQSMVTSMGRQIGSALARGLMGSLTKKK